MSYARWGEGGSSVYVFGSGRCIICMDCTLDDGRNPAETPADMLAHLQAHRDRGDVVPERAFERLREESDSGL